MITVANYRETVVVNLDPGNDKLPYPCAVDVMGLISLEKVMDEHKLGPNGGLIYCMEYLEHNIEWLKEKIDKCCKGSNLLFGAMLSFLTTGSGTGKYILFDCPGQIELYTHHHSMRNICELMQEEWDFRVSFALCHASSLSASLLFHFLHTGHNCSKPR